MQRSLSALTTYICRMFLYYGIVDIFFVSTSSIFACVNV